jgi:hypothetical protein
MARISPVRGRMTMPVMLLRRVLLQRLGQRGFHDVLHGGINRQHHVQAVFRINILVTHATSSRCCLVGFRHAPAANAAQRLLHRAPPRRARRSPKSGVPPHSSPPPRENRPPARPAAHLDKSASDPPRQTTRRPQVVKKSRAAPGKLFLVHAKRQIRHRRYNALPGFFRHTWPAGHNAGHW